MRPLRSAERLWIYSGDPTGAEVSSFNPQLGDLVVDIETPTLWQKTTDLNDNSGFSEIGASTIPTQITVAAETTDTTCSVLFVTSASGNLAPKTNTGLTFNSTTGKLTATAFSGPITVANSTDTTGFLAFFNDATGDLEPKTNAAFAVNATTGLLTLTGAISAAAGTFSGTLTASNGTITGGAGNMTITSGTGASRTLTLRTTTSGGVATTALTLNADQTAAFAETFTAKGATFSAGGSSNGIAFDSGIIRLQNTSDPLATGFVLHEEFGTLVLLYADGITERLMALSSGAKLTFTTGATNERTFTLPDADADIPTASGHTIIVNGVTYTLPGVTATLAPLVSPSFTTPTLGVAIGTSLALGGATIGSHALGITGTVNVSGAGTFGGIVTGNFLFTSNYVQVGSSSGIRFASNGTRILETGADALKISDSATTGFGSLALLSLTSSGSLTLGYRAITALRTLDATDYLINCTANTFTVTLPTAVGIAGREYVIKNSGSGVITIATTSSQTIDGQLTAILAVQYQSVTVISDGANWIIV